ncbi:uncharacterized protein MYCFIDRAFT_178320 [Pseudocercospora fijiensis CIRAD86]|uniref:Uncharacterized protein n=1 Tax=Pseudocercospora fijiensis (strain CIRAD86) TaxID=383855 RepID=M3A589_PSEFD|nr:uncharacterized protein MYCFIDRAFT_178320 [Pseudocercospora fijiensis CIRAD86]EME79761.1 hypothetical protein MYCFIDRAFT_178320 [Pseudocercospora fijiensis CIRAD86]
MYAIRGLQLPHFFFRLSLTFKSLSCSSFHPKYPTSTPSLNPSIILQYLVSNILLLRSPSPSHEACPAVETIPLSAAAKNLHERINRRNHEIFSMHVTRHPTPRNPRIPFRNFGCRDSSAASGESEGIEITRTGLGRKNPPGGGGGGGGGGGFILFYSAEFFGCRVSISTSWQHLEDDIRNSHRGKHGVILRLLVSLPSSRTSQGRLRRLTSGRIELFVSLCDAWVSVRLQVASLKAQPTSDSLTNWMLSKIRDAAALRDSMSGLNLVNAGEGLLEGTPYTGRSVHHGSDVEQLISLLASVDHLDFSTVQYGHKPTARQRLRKQLKRLLKQLDYFEVNRKLRDRSYSILPCENYELCKVGEFVKCPVPEVLGNQRVTYEDWKCLSSPFGSIYFEERPQLVTRRFRDRCLTPVCTPRSGRGFIHGRADLVRLVSLNDSLETLPGEYHPPIEIVRGSLTRETCLELKFNGLGAYLIRPGASKVCRLQVICWSADTIS